MQEGGQWLWCSCLKYGYCANYLLQISGFYADTIYECVYNSIQGIFRLVQEIPSKYLVP
jgi:hypothetical protein